MIAQADAVRIPLADRSVHCVVTSPPYWGLRKYAGEQGEEPLGLEPTPERHVERMVEIFREVKRVLRDDGVVWLNYGDCYGHGTESRRPSGNTRGISDKTSDAQNIDRHGGRAGNLMMMPHRVALALQADGWIVRQDLVWYKRNPMPESVNGWRWQRERARDPEWKEKRYGGKGEDPQSRTERLKMNVASARAAGVDHETGAVGMGWEYGDDLELKRGSWRHTRAHEYVFMLTKKMQYFSNQEAVREASDPDQETHNRRYAKNYDNELRIDGGQPGNVNNRGIHERPGSGGRNPRSVLDVPTAPYSGAHYATFPPNLIAPLIRATCPRRCCPVCGQGWAAVVEKSQGQNQEWAQDNNPTDKEVHLVETGDRGGHGKLNRGSKEDYYANRSTSTVSAYRPTCSHKHTQEEAVPGIVFDPFVGSGTTVKVAQDLLRKGIGIDISMEYLDLQAKVRIGQGSPSNQLDGLPLFSDIEPTPPLNKQDSLGKSTYTGFNARWKERHK